MTKNNKILSELYSLLHGGMTHSTDRIKKIADNLQNPQDNYTTIHVAGTNGKGSVCSLLASILQQSGLKVGLYTSPHIIKFNERICINGKQISDDEIEHFYLKIRNLALSNNASFFEITTAIAFDYFAENKIDIAVVETGLGGRLDSTNILKPCATVITTIDKDHCNLLGNTIENIASEKAGILKPNTPYLIQDNNPSIKNIFRKKANELNSKLIESTTDIELLKITDNFKMKINIRWPENYKHNSTTIYSDLIGKHQIRNIQTAIQTADFLSKQIPTITQDSIIDGIQNVIKNTNFHFRIECVCANPLVIIDISHNPQSVAMLVNTIKETNKNKWNIIFGAMKDKDIKAMLINLQPICNKLTIIEAKIDRAASKNDILNIATELNFNNIETATDITETVHTIKTQSTPTVICGSFYIMESISTALQLSL